MYNVHIACMKGICIHCTCRGRIFTAVIGMDGGWEERGVCVCVGVCGCGCGGGGGGGGGGNKHITNIHEVVDIREILLQKVFEDECVNLKGMLQGRNMTHHIILHLHTVSRHF